MPLSPAAHSWVYPHEYRDSMVLMNLSADLAKLPGVERAMAIMGTDANRELLTAVGLLIGEAAAAGPNDLIVAIKATDEGAAAAAAQRLQEMLSQHAAPTVQTDGFFHSLERASQARPESNIALISVPGRFAAREARKALELGLNVFLFSDNVPLEDEVALKEMGRQRGLLVMGPDCGTAIVNGVALGFANVVRRGNIGIVGASGTGIQEVCCLLDRAGLGISHALGTGGRDLSARVGGSTTLQAMELLEDDPDTHVLVLISKPPAPEVAAKVLERAGRCRKPVVACLLGQRTPAAGSGNARVAGTLAEAAAAAAFLAGRAMDTSLEPSPEERSWALAQRSRIAPGQRFVRGLFSGGTLCEEAMLVWRDSLGGVWSNAPLEPSLGLPDPMCSRDHTALDLGDDFFTTGRPHPMIDPAFRRERLVAEARDPSTAVLLLDLVLGYGAHEDMAGALVPAILEARRLAEAEGRHLPVIAHVCGTEADPQGLNRQEEQLRSAGVALATSNVAAAHLAAIIALGDQRGGNGLGDR